MQGYLGDREASDYAVDPDGWLKTGDIGYRENGKFYIVDRKKVGLLSRSRWGGLTRVQSGND